MNYEAVMSVPLSRPKIHRSPPVGGAYAKKSFHPPAALIKLLAMVVALVLVMAMIMRLMVLSSSGPLFLESMIKHRSLKPVFAPIEKTDITERKDGDTIIISGKSGTIIGQMVQIPAQNEQITEVRPVSEVDNHAGRELLSIISKY